MKQKLAIYIFSLIPAVTQAVEIQPSIGSSYRLSDQKNFTKVEDAKTFDLKSADYALITSSSQLPILVINPKSSKAVIEIPATDNQEVLSSLVEPQVNKAVNEIVDGTMSAQIMIQQKNYEQALRITMQLQQKYSAVANLYFLEGTIHYLMNNKSLAITKLEQGLTMAPENTQGQNLLKQLKGGK
ncbi:MAG: hypothetical protein HUU57_05575 [Bdellovibrio sp.]|nr:hypothetical protein [Bdellovibrio sp.]